ncbi:M67 family metallopeptidase [Paenibacillus sp. OV219]|uniref:M67 family metallopeptidase n=1 Tax=Paenibacillus sp. OV219 TaxID=1884377 RepID=UPI0008B4B985|nr:M67 family metallopeptidase [Paenibacillus sp. OV219]SEM70306.1 Proteasome lid subunit RPN8/RPN11, contains Jab1/MPN metalloenzyme (JAMM) motif [Paenibacillus sp. OV219]
MSYRNTELTPDNDQPNAVPNRTFVSMPTAARLALEAHEQLLRSCSDAMPSEACGVLAGTLEHIDGVPLVSVTHVYPVNNAEAVSRLNNQFAFEPASWIQALYHMQKNRQSLVGYYHSHPTSMPLPSAADMIGIRTAAARDTSYWIISLANSARHPVVQPYWIHNDPHGQLCCSPLMLTEIRV